MAIVAAAMDIVVVAMALALVANGGGGRSRPFKAFAFLGQWSADCPWYCFGWVRLLEV